ncbi:hypothetical protein [Rufibacter sp. LB8]|uniref:hypothetical protein n=1 Tax=Rufibacter sp. LB8 TaxID=2777781 RepID=UPI00178C2256|nr:hypothetical protein [Rufibacter sp. LB8]
MELDNPIEHLKYYLSENINDDCGAWEYEHIPHLESVVGSLTEKQSEEFSRVIWDWPNNFLFELASPILFGGNKYLRQDYLFCKIFSEVEQSDNLDFLSQNLGACFYSLSPNEYDIEMLQRIKLNLLYVFENETDNYWINNYKELLEVIDKKITSANIV